MRKPQKPVVGSAERVLRVIQLLGQRARITVTEVSAELDISPSTAYRLLVTCCESGFARQDAPGGKYEIGAALHELALAATRSTTLRDAAAAQLQRASRDLRETVSIVVLEGRDVRFVETLEGDQTVRVAAPRGGTLPAHATAGGRAMLAFLPPEEVQRRFPTRTLAPVNSATITGWDELVRELDRVRTRGWAVQIGETNVDLGAVAFPIVDGLGMARAALVATVPRSRLRARPDAERIATALGPYAQRIQRRLRGSH